MLRAKTELLPSLQTWKAKRACTKRALRASGGICTSFWGALTRVLGGRRTCFHPGTHRENSSESAVCDLQAWGSISELSDDKATVDFTYAETYKAALGGGSHSAFGVSICIYGPLGAAGYNG